MTIGEIDMKDKLANLIEQIDSRIDRRSFVATAAGAGAAAFGSTPSRAFGQDATLKKRGHLILGLGGVESSNSLDPALTISQVPYNVTAHISDLLVENSPTGEITRRIAEDHSSAPDAKV
jgi:peptide/nickel transport system substrate-binding protein